MSSPKEGDTADSCWTHTPPMAERRHGRGRPRQAWPPLLPPWSKEPSQLEPTNLMSVLAWPNPLAPCLCLFSSDTIWLGRVLQNSAHFQPDTTACLLA